VTVPLKGMRAEDATVSLDDHLLVITATSPDGSEFARSTVALARPVVDTAGISAVVVDGGKLRVHVPRSALGLDPPIVRATIPVKLLDAPGAQKAKLPETAAKKR
jgi:hypothetical protein